MSFYEQALQRFLRESGAAADSDASRALAEQAFLAGWRAPAESCFWSTVSRWKTKNDPPDSSGGSFLLLSFSNIRLRCIDADGLRGVVPFHAHAQHEAQVA